MAVSYTHLSIADQMVDSGIMSIWNFAPIDVKVPEGVVVELSLIHI